MIPVVNSRIDVMSNIVPHEEINSVVVLDELARQVRESRQAAQQAGVTVLHHILDAGDALNKAQTRVTLGWKRWLQDNCSIPLAGGELQPLSVRTALLYQQLAHHRGKIEAEIARVGELSLRGARRLISKPAKKKPSQMKPGSERPDDPVRILVLSTMTKTDWVEALTLYLGLDGFVHLLVGNPKDGPRLPAAWREKLETRAGEQAIRRLQQRHPNKRLRSLRLVHDAGSSAPH